MDSVEALRRLEDSRRQIDILDHEIMELIAQRTFLAGEIVQAKIVLGMDIEDKKREAHIQEKIKEIALEKKIDPTSLSQIMKILTSLSKKEQKKLLKR
jgi:chorismate mutase